MRVSTSPATLPGDFGERATPVAAAAIFKVAALLWLICVALGWSSPGAARAMSQLEHSRWTAADDGPSQVGALAQTRDGYLWLGSNGSLLRFDGMRFARYQPPGGQALGTVSALLATDAGLWVGLRAGGVRFIAADGMASYPPQAGLPGGVVYELAEDRQGNIWAAANDGLARFDGEHWQRISVQMNFPGRHARSVFVDRDGVLWAANEERLFYLPEGASAFVDSGLAVGWASRITQAPDGAIWVADRYDGTLQSLATDTGEISRLPSSADGSNGLLFDRAGALWVGTVGDGIRYMAPSSSQTGAKDTATEEYTGRDGLSSDYIWPLLEDSEGNIWVGTSSGLDRFRPRAVTTAPLPHNAINFALAIGTDGSLWAGSGNLPAMRLRAGRLDMLDMPPPVTAALTDCQGRIWMGGPSGIWRSRGDRLEQLTPLPTAAALDSSVRAMALDASGTLWVSINRLGLFAWRDGHWQPMPAPSSQPSQTMPVSASADGQGRLWFGYRDNLIVTRHGSDTRHWGSADGLEIGHVTAITLNGKHIWVGGQRGMAYFNGRRFHGLRLPDNGLFDNIYAIIAVPSQARNGFAEEDLWVHAKSGIYQLPAAELAQAMADPDHNIHYRSYDVMGRLANDPHQVLPLPTAIRGRDGRLWFATANGVVEIDPGRHAQRDATPKVAIESMSVDGGEVSVTSPRVPATMQRIEIGYTALSLSAPEAMHFRYRLDGFDRNWHHAGSQRQATYTGLAPGDYRFRVVALNQDGIASQDEATLSFSVPQVFYLKPPFLVAAGLLLAGLLWLLYRANMRRSAEQLRARLEERHAERERIARELHDTLLQGVQGLMLRFQAVAQTIPQGAPARAKIDQTLDRADQVLSEGRDRVLDLRSAETSPSSLLAALARVGRECVQDGAGEFRASARGARRPLQPIVREEAYRIGHEAIVNAFKHSGGAHIQLHVAYGLREFEVRISDDGIGIDTAYLTSLGRPSHWGLRGMHERACNVGAKLTIKRASPRGTEIRLSMPASSAYRRPPSRIRRWWHRLRKHRS